MEQRPLFNDLSNTSTFLGHPAVLNINIVVYIGIIVYNVHFIANFFFWGGALIGEGNLPRKSHFLKGCSLERAFIRSFTVFTLHWSIDQSLMLSQHSVKLAELPGCSTLRDLLESSGQV